MSEAGTRERILEAALSGFLDEGFERTTIARIREKSGVSNGALFHHFSSKEAIADALYLEAMTSYQEGLRSLLRHKPRTLRAAVGGTIVHQLRWIEEHPSMARFVYMRGHLDWDSPAGAELETLNRELSSAARSWMAPMIETGAIRPMSILMVSAILSGPVHAVSQRWLAGQLAATPTSYADELIEAACAALSGTPTTFARTNAEAAQVGRLEVELIASDGSVVAQGSATAELRPPDRVQARSR